MANKKRSVLEKLRNSRILYHIFRANDKGHFWSLVAALCVEFGGFAVRTET
jgi:hypothetical protein